MVFKFFPDFDPDGYDIRVTGTRNAFRVFGQRDVWPTFSRVPESRRAGPVGTRSGDGGPAERLTANERMSVPV